jgi:hypothetical protein
MLESHAGDHMFKASSGHSSLISPPPCQDILPQLAPHPLFTPERYMADIKLEPQEADHFAQDPLLHSISPQQEPKSEVSFY